MRVVFMGTPEFAVPALEMLIEEHQVVAVYTQPDRRKGRGKKVQFPPVKEVALPFHIPIYQPEKIKKPEEVAQLKELAPDVIVVVAYGQILSKEILEIPTHGCVNIHGSLLPQLRGASPINMAIVRGHKKTGLTTMLMDEGLDTGHMLVKTELAIGENTTFGELHHDLKRLSPKVLRATLKGLEEGTLKPEAQDDQKATYAPLLNKEMGRINWSLPADQLHNLIRGFNPWPVAHTTYEDLTMKIYTSRVIHSPASQAPGTILSVDEDGFVVACGQGKLLISEIQFPNKRKMLVKDYLRGNTIEVGKQLGGM